MIVHIAYVQCDCCSRRVELGVPRPGWHSAHHADWCKRCWAKIKKHTAKGRGFTSAKKRATKKEKRHVEVAAGVLVQ